MSGKKKKIQTFAYKHFYFNYIDATFAVFKIDIDPTKPT